MEDQSLFEELNPPTLTPELRAELMAIAKDARALAERIDKVTHRRVARELDANEEPTFKYAAKVVIPKDFYLTKRLVEYALNHGFKDQQVKDLADTFIRFYNKTGRKWQDWSRVWMDWVRNEEKRIKSGGSASPAMTSDRMKKW